MTSRLTSKQFEKRLNDSKVSDSLTVYREIVRSSLRMRGMYNNGVGTTQAQRLSATRGRVRNKYRQNGNSLMGCAYIRVGGVNEPIR